MRNLGVFLKEHNLCAVLLVISLVFITVSCGDDEENSEIISNNPSLSISSIPEEIKPFVGMWTVDGGKLTYGESLFMFYQDKVLRVSSGPYNPRYDWDFSPSTSLLTTNDNQTFTGILQWNITQKTDDTWTGMGIDKNDGYLYNAKRTFKEDFFDVYPEELVMVGAPDITLTQRRKGDQSYVEQYTKDNMRKPIIVEGAYRYNGRSSDRFIYTYYDKTGVPIDAQDLSNGQRILDLDVIRREEEVSISVSPQVNPNFDFSTLPYPIITTSNDDVTWSGVKFKNTLEIHHPLSYSQVYYVCNIKMGYFLKSETQRYKDWSGSIIESTYYSDLVRLDSIVGTFVPISH